MYFRNAKSVLCFSFRYSFTILANIGVFLNVFLLLQFVSHHSGLDAKSVTRADLWIFSVRDTMTTCISILTVVSSPDPALQGGERVWHTLSHYWALSSQHFQESAQIFCHVIATRPIRVIPPVLVVN